MRALGHLRSVGVINDLLVSREPLILSLAVAPVTALGGVADQLIQ